MPTIVENQIEIINTIKLLIYKESPSLIEKIDFEDDNVFLESLLFAYFNSNNNSFDSEILEEIMQGYFLKRENISLNYSFNKNNIAYLPSIGYIKKNESSVFDTILKVDEFEVIKEIHPILEPYFRETYKGHVVNSNPSHKSVWKENYEDFEKAILLIKNNIPDFYRELVFANKRIYFHDNPKIINFASMSTFGMLYFYVVSKYKIIYFIEELIHQGSHNYLSIILHDRGEYFKVDVDNMRMRDFSKQDWDYRTIYSAFHGLYTVCKRVEYFDVLLSKNIFNGQQKHELLGRLTDQFSRFRTGLELLDFDSVYTDKGKELYFSLDTKCENLLKKYEILPSLFDLSNRDLDFRYEDFCSLNPIEDFYNNETQGIFNF